MIENSTIIGVIERLLQFPYAKICRHYVALHLLSILEQHGAPVSQELARAVVTADDEEALRLLPALSSAPGASAGGGAS